MRLSLSAGDTFLTVSKSPSVSDHLWFIISDPTLDEHNILFVNLTTWIPDRKQDESCILNRGEHPFIRHKSIINYSRAQIASLANISALHEQNLIIMKEPVPDAVLDRIRQGIRVSPYAIHRHRQILQDQGL